MRTPCPALAQAYTPVLQCNSTPPSLCTFDWEHLQSGVWGNGVHGFHQPRCQQVAAPDLMDLLLQGDAAVSVTPQYNPSHQFPSCMLRLPCMLCPPLHAVLALHAMSALHAGPALHAVQEAEHRPLPRDLIPCLNKRKGMGELHAQLHGVQV